MVRIIYRLAALVSLIPLSGCAGSEITTIKHKSEVEIAPGKWLFLERETDVYTADLEAKKNPPKNPHQLSPLDAAKQFADHAAAAGVKRKELDSQLAFDWNGKRVEWRGKEIPVTLREHEGGIYMIGYNREDILKCRLFFFRMNQTGTGFEKIKPEIFPRQIATQNMSINLHGPRKVRIGADSISVDTWQVLRTLDIQNPYFTLSLTAAMWYQIETGTEYDQIQFNDLLTQQFLQDYVAKYKPIALPTIIKEPQNNTEQSKPIQLEMSSNTTAIPVTRP